MTGDQTRDRTPGGPDEALFARLRAANPVPDEQVLPGPDAPRPVADLERILAGGRRPRRWRWRPLVGIPAVALVAATAGVLLTRDVSEPLSVGCYAEASTASDRAIVSADAAQGPAGVCQELWDEGVFPTQPRPDELVECVLETGAVAVFPTDSCDDVADPDPDPDGEPGSGQDPTGAATDPGAPADDGRPLPPEEPVDADEQRQLITARDRIVDLVLAGCVTPDEAATPIGEILDDAGLDRWTIAFADGFTSDAPCVYPAFIVEERTVLLTPGPRP